jgi:hypothetical protein
MRQAARLRENLPELRNAVAVGRGWRVHRGIGRGGFTAFAHDDRDVAQVAQPAVSPTASRLGVPSKSGDIREVRNICGLATCETEDWQSALQVLTYWEWKSSLRTLHAAALQTKVRSMAIVGSLLAAVLARCPAGQAFEHVAELPDRLETGRVTDLRDWFETAREQAFRSPDSEEGSGGS